MVTHIDASNTPGTGLDPDEERALDARLIAAGYRMPTGSLNRPRRLAKKRPRWLAFLYSLMQGRD
ncbi:hypothetical protein [Longimicrobium sp.]|uniref:hypothetical protein n=1 Tax=Longimicrobium sp. TaxID=2029185 RepID=UPI002B6FFA82|nr:hypothetical protein [Longimicrobium sp.]HSU16451.1 hypothetical protein [Longimicrobium sp.]